jgi:hypothetical protein
MRVNPAPRAVSRASIVFAPRAIPANGGRIKMATSTAAMPMTGMIRNTASGSKRQSAA